MRAIYLIARREFLSYVATWGFWLSLLSVPMFMALGFGMPILIESSQPTRYYVLVDQTGGRLEQAVYDQIDATREEQRAAMMEAATEMLGDNPQIQAALPSWRMTAMSASRPRRPTWTVCAPISPAHSSSIRRTANSRCLPRSTCPNRHPATFRSNTGAPT